MHHISTRKPAESLRPCETTDRELVARFQRGETDAFDQLVTRHQKQTALLAHRLLGWPDDVEDTVQAVFLSVLENLHRFRGESSFRTWLTTITINRCRWILRRRRLRDRVLKLLWKQGRQTSGQGGSSDEDRHEQIRRAVRNLPSRYREPIVLRYFEEFSIDEVSQILKLSRNAGETRLTRTRQKLKKFFSESEENRFPRDHQCSTEDYSEIFSTLENRDERTISLEAPGTIDCHRKPV